MLVTSRSLPTWRERWRIVRRDPCEQHVVMSIVRKAIQHAEQLRCARNVELTHDADPRTLRAVLDRDLETVPVLRLGGIDAATGGHRDLVAVGAVHEAGGTHPP